MCHFTSNIYKYINIYIYIYYENNYITELD